MAHTIVHWEIMGPAGADLPGFYSGLFGWSPQTMEGFDGYEMVSADEAGVGGAVGTGSDDMPNYVTVYIEVDDVDVHLARIEEAGGKTISPKMVIPDVVTYGLFADPGGNVVGLVEAESPSAG